MTDQEQAASPETNVETVDNDLTQQPTESQSDLNTEDTATSNNEESTVQADEKAKKQKGFQNKINKLVSDRSDEKRRGDELQRRLDEIQAATPQVSTEAKEPTLEDFEHDDEKFMAAKISYEVKKQSREIQLGQIKREQAKTRSDAEAIFREKALKFQEKVPDFQEVVGRVPSLPDDIYNEILLSDDSAELSYYLGDHLDVAHELASMSSVKGGKLLESISLKLSKTTKQVKLTNAPDPIKSIEGTGKALKDWSSLSQEEVSRRLRGGKN